MTGMDAPRPWNPLSDLSPEARERLTLYQSLLLRYNRKINLISRKTEADFEERHLVHTLSLGLRAIPPGWDVVDWGSGGGLPAIPLAIRFPDVRFHAVEAIEKKALAVKAIARSLALENLTVHAVRAEDWAGRAHLSVSRATAGLADLWAWHTAVAVEPSPAPGAPIQDAWHPGLVCLKGGDLQEEVAALRRLDPAVVIRMHPLNPLLGRPYYTDKSIVEVTRDPAIRGGAVPDAAVRDEPPPRPEGRPGGPA